MKDDMYNTPWRRTASVIYKRPRESKIWGSFDADITETLKYIANKKELGVPLTLTQVFAAALAKSYKHDVPQLNCFVRRGSIIPRKDVGIFISVEIPGGEMTGFVIHDAGSKTVFEIQEYMSNKVKKYRERQEAGAVKNKDMLAYIPWPLRSWIAGTITFVTNTLGMSIRPLKVNPGSFGSVMISNIGTHGLEYGMAAILPVSNLPMVILMGMVEKKPVVRDGEVVVRDILPLSATMDHRIADGGLGGKLACALQKYLSNPLLLEE